MKVLVTGGCGFIGSHLVDRLIDLGKEVIVLDDLSTGFLENLYKEARFVKGDVRNVEDVKHAFEFKPDIVCHIAGQASNILSFIDPSNDIDINVYGTLNILKECIKHETPRLLYASSMAVYGHPKQLPINENHPAIPISYYGITKYAAERYIHSTAERNDLDFDFNVTSFRMFNVYGPRQSLTNIYQGPATIFMANIFNNQPITIFGDGEQTRDFCYIGDVIDVWVLALENPKTFGEVFNIGCGYSISINKLADLVLSSFGLDRETYKVVYDKERPGDQRHMLSDISKIQKVFNWKPKIEIEEGIRETFEWAVLEKDKFIKR